MRGMGYAPLGAEAVELGKPSGPGGTRGQTIAEVPALQVAQGGEDVVSEVHGIARPAVTTARHLGTVSRTGRTTATADGGKSSGGDGKDNPWQPGWKTLAAGAAALWFATRR